MNQHKPAEDLREMGLMQHLEDLRWAVARCFVALFVAFPFAYTFSDEFITLSRELAGIEQFITLAPAEDFLQGFKVGGIIAFFACLPFFLYQIFAFIAPGLYKKERNWLRWSLLVSYFLFLGGALFGLFIICPMALKFLIEGTSESVQYQGQLKEYISFVLTISTGMGIISQLPIVTVLLYTMGLASLSVIVNSRPYVVVAIFVLSAIITPPDVVSQILLSIPTWFIFELSILFCFLMDRSKSGKSVKPVVIGVCACFVGAALGLGSWLYYRQTKADTALPAIIASAPLDPASYTQLATEADGRDELFKLLSSKSSNAQINNLSAETLLKHWHELAGSQKQSLLEWYLVPSARKTVNDKKKNNLSLTISRRAILPAELQFHWQLIIDDKHTILWPDSLNNYRMADHGSDSESISRHDILDSLPMAKSLLFDGKEHTVSFVLVPVKATEKGIPTSWTKPVSSSAIHWPSSL